MGIVAQLNFVDFGIQEVDGALKFSQIATKIPDDIFYILRELGKTFLKQFNLIGCLSNVFS
jgi:hypothetical protein